jgi:hypothetical protein
MSIGFNSLPRDLCVYLASFLPVKDVAHLGACSKEMHAVCSTEWLWQRLSDKMRLPPPRTVTYKQQVIQFFIDGRISRLVLQGNFDQAREAANQHTNSASRYSAHSFICAHIPIEHPLFNR